MKKFEVGKWYKIITGESGYWADRTLNMNVVGSVKIMISDIIEGNEYGESGKSGQVEKIKVLEDVYIPQVHGGTTGLSGTLDGSGAGCTALGGGWDALTRTCGVFEHYEGILHITASNYTIDCDGKGGIYNP